MTDTAPPSPPPAEVVGRDDRTQWIGVLMQQSINDYGPGDSNFVTPLLTVDECRTILALTQRDAKPTGSTPAEVVEGAAALAPTEGGGDACAHTPGPWFCLDMRASYMRSLGWTGPSIDRILITNKNGQQLQACEGDNSVIARIQFDNRSDELAESNLADGRLIAAAPEMLEALYSAQQWLRRWESAEPHLSVIDAAIAKATGRASAAANPAPTRAEMILCVARDMAAALKDARKGLTHEVPESCWATGPLTGDPIEDLVVCPGCRANHRIDTALTKYEAVKAEISVDAIAAQFKGLVK